MDWEEALAIIDKLRESDSVTIEFCYKKHGDAVFIHLGTKESTEGGRIVGSSGESEGAFERALISVKKRRE